MSGLPDPGATTASRSGAGPASNARESDHDSADIGGVRARLVAHDSPDCPVVDALPDGVIATDVRIIALDDVTIEQFRVDRSTPANRSISTDRSTPTNRSSSTDRSTPANRSSSTDRSTPTNRSVPVDPVFEADGGHVYRRRVEPRDACPYRTIESLGYPVTDATVGTNPDRLRVTLHLPTVEPLGSIVDAVESTGATVTLDRLTHSGDRSRADPVVVDRGRLTDRQREVLCAARKLGYFSYPREASAEEVAEAVGIARSTFAEHLAAAQRRVIGGVVDGVSGATDRRG